MMVCRHFGAYRYGKKAGVGYTSPKHSTIKTGCKAFISVGKATRLRGQPWMIEGHHFVHNHPINRDAVDQKLNEENLDYVVDSIKSGKALKILTPGGVIELALEDLIKVQQNDSRKVSNNSMKSECTLKLEEVEVKLENIA